jgi:hypothetical protein
LPTTPTIRPVTRPSRAVRFTNSPSQRAALANSWLNAPSIQ